MATDGTRPRGRPDAAPRRFWTTGFTLLMLGAAAALAVLLALGNWQVNRLAWKEDLLATIERRMDADPVPLATVLDRAGRGAEVNWTPVRAEGTFAEGEALVYATDRGNVGWHVLAPLRLADGRAVIVNRGFVPDSMRLASERPTAAPPETSVAVEGLARDPTLEKPNRFVPENAPDKGEFYWRDFPALRAELGLAPDETVPVLIDVGPTPAGTLPVGGTTIVSLPNNHFGYAVTWFGIAVALVGVVGALMWQRWRRVRRGG